MSGKRALKKQQKRQGSALAELEEMIRRGDDDRVVARAAELFPDPAASPLGARWAEAADRALRQSLARADFNRLESLLWSLRRTGRPRPLAALSEAVLDLAAGRRTAARSKLEGLEKLPSDLADLVVSLQALAANQDQQDQNGSPYLRAAGDLLRICRGLEVCGFAPAAADREALARSLHTLRGAAPEAAGELGRFSDRLLESAERCVRLLDDLAALEAALLRREDGAPRLSETVLAWLRGAGRAAALAAAQPNVTNPGSPLLATLHHTARSRWRAVLERVLAQEGTVGLAVLFAAEPKLLLADVDLSGGMQEGLAALRKRAQAGVLNADRHYGELAVLLRNRSRTATTEGEVATVWGLELWARGLPDRPEVDPEEDEDEEDDFDLPQEPRPHRTLVRLEEMAAEIGTRFPPAHRAEIAGVLRGELFKLCEKIRFCEHTAGAALSLLEHEPGGAGQTGLFIAGVAGAVAGGDHRALRALQDRLSHRGPRGQPPAGDHREQDFIRRLMIGVAQEYPGKVARILDILRPLFDGDWLEMAELVAEELGGNLALELTEATLEAEDGRELSRILGEIRGTLSLLRPALAETPGFAAMGLLLDCWLPDRHAAEKRLAVFLAAAPDLAAPLTAARMFDKAILPWTPQGIRTAFNGLIHAAIERLDHPGQLWCDDVPLLARAGSDGSLRRLEQKVERLLTGPAREKALAEIENVRDLRRPARRSPKPRTAKRKPTASKTRKTPRRAPQLPLDFP